MSLHGIGSEYHDSDKFTACSNLNQVMYMAFSEDSPKRYISAEVSSPIDNRPGSGKKYDKIMPPL